MEDVKLQRVTVIGGGLAGSECAWQLARRGVPVTLREMKPHRRSPAHKTDQFAELVCSNSLRSDNPESAIGLLHAELRALSSVILGSADAHRVPAGDALAVDREAFSAAVTRSVHGAPGVEVVTGEVDTLPEGTVVVATGPLTSEALTKELERYVGEKLYFYDSIAPIVAGDSIDMGIAFRASRYGKGGGDDYINLPMNKEEYYRFIAEVKAGQKLQPHSFEEPRYFEGCLPIEVMADRGDDTLAYGPMKPVGLKDPRTGEEPYAVVQLRMEDRAGTAWNMVGFQTRLTWGEQKRIFTTCVPGLANAEFLRMGQIHRNTFIDSPRLLGRDLSLKAEPRLFFAGQITGVEGYVESAACGYLTALAVYARLTGREFVPPPATTALGSLYRHVTGEAHPPDYDYQPSNVIFGLFPPLPGRVKKADKRVKYAERARADLAAWLPSVPPARELQRTA
ncbi:methylenetetrahydrofolate--tRNA-(uracil(54)-C(5))-methyltransferase (FADH(2)-oxidizing) TrmFO [Archangium violaceum]|uniref:methylenetetrahydrofolate--tRNA-(uracil(54)- C(5))-methyltransferase (FADH(2)-oxidizing) TrmFO n=1 Tax=Archangium violaceum TaxID=83451 RepID=UPI00193C8265|nr:methylenetetrahydrofolate--tRNA-(uracil(54)-C(5))-methyltransferase (FADH(2)-oxidizing) TrmFO [Archangium violaceum]QRK07656.1 methylenetetrahydrofolate--tRNA-(uracil(54)-C(5))-methyltransferase (FADH(2)-oxidizing) TrmFO [Archangium violaceum]